MTKDKKMTILHDTKLKIIVYYFLIKIFDIINDTGIEFNALNIFNVKILELCIYLYFDIRKSTLYF